MQDVIRMTVSLPRDAVEFLDRHARHEVTSRNAQIVRSIRERMQAAGEQIGVLAPAATQTTALASGVSTHG